PDRPVSRCRRQCSPALSGATRRSGVRLRQQWLLVRRLIGDRCRTMCIARGDEARCRELAEHGDTRGARAIACRRAAAGGGERGEVGGGNHGVVAGAAVEDVLPPAADQHVVAIAAGQVSLPGLPMRTSSPSPPLAVSWMAPAASPDAVMTSSPASPLMTSWS